MATGALRHLGRIWWDNAHLNIFKMKAIKLITWAEFGCEYHRKYFYTTVRAKKKTELLSLRQTEGMSVAEYQNRFMILERFAPGALPTEEDRVDQFVAGLRISIRSIVATLTCATLGEAAVRATECEHAHESHHLARAAGQTGGQGQGWRQRDQDHQGSRQQRQ